MKSAKIALILKRNAIFKINDKVNRKIENNSIFSLTSSIINEILIKKFKYFLAYFVNKNN